jgi:hypothetical protein
MALKRPILIGGLGLTATLWLLDTVHFDIFDSSTLLSAMALGTGVWWWRQRDRSPALPSTPTPLVTDRAAVATEISSLQTLINTLETEIADAGDPAVQLSASPADYRQQVLTIESGLDRQRLAIAVLGDPYTGKSTLIERLSEALPDASAAKLSFTEIRLSPETDVEADLAQQDAVLLVTDSDLTESALVVLNRCLLAGQAALLVFNKQDNYHPDDRQTILDQLQHHAATLPTRVTVVPAPLWPPGRSKCAAMKPMAPSGMDGNHGSRVRPVAEVKSQQTSWLTPPIW